MANRLFRFIGKKKGTRQSGLKLWSVGLDVTVSAFMLLTGIVMLASVVTLGVQSWVLQETNFSIWVALFWGVIGAVLLAFGGTRTLQTIWLTGASAERRGAIVSLAKDVELFNELSGNHAFPNVPQGPLASIEPCQKLNFRIKHRQRSRAGLWLSGILTFGFVAVSTVLLLLGIQSISKRSSQLDSDRDQRSAVACDVLPNLFFSQTAYSKIGTWSDSD